MKFKGTVIITDPCYIMRSKNHGTTPMTNDDWVNSRYGNKLEVLGIKNYITKDTGVGDWTCEVINTDTKDKIGEFCADSGQVSVLLMSEVLKYNPDFDYHIKSPWSTTVIENFDGDITISEIATDADHTRTVEGTGSINFKSTFTGF